jgi:hypothetical protein
MNRTKIIVSCVVIAALALIAYPLYAHCGKCAADGKKIAAQLDANKFTLAKAVTAAEEHSKGRAVSAITELGPDDQMMLHVWCITEAASDAPKIMKYFVDTKSGSVKGMKEVHEIPNSEQAHAHGEGHEGTPHGSDHASAKMNTNQTVDVGCGACIYKMPGVTGCPLALMIDGKAYLVEGDPQPKWPNHDYCDKHCTAVVSGTIKDGKFIATNFEPKK